LARAGGSGALADLTFEVDWAGGDGLFKRWGLWVLAYLSDLN